MIQPESYKFRSEVWLYPGPGAWYFITVPKRLSAQISDFYAERKRGWGSLRVQVKIGNTTWGTSIFPDSKTGTYLLPIKKDVRKAEAIDLGSKPEVEIVVKD